MINYYDRLEVSNSDLSWLYSQLYPTGDYHDPTEAYAFGSLIDAMITEICRVNFLKRTLDGKRIKAELFKTALAMKKAFWADDFCCMFATGSNGQKVSIVNDKEFEYNGVKFKLNVRCKWDIWRDDWGWGGDIKSTTATSQYQFEKAAYHFKYPRQRSWYMDIEDAPRDVLIGISKVKPHKVFKINITRDTHFYKTGKEEYEELAFRHYLLFGSNKAV